MNVSYLAAFFGGVISLFTPCSAMIIPIFASALTQRKHHPIQVISTFSLGLIVSLLPLAVGATLLNQVFLLYRRPISLVIGVIFLIFGLALILGYHLRVPDLSGKIASNHYLAKFGSIFTLGLIAGIGSTACIGPILGAIISLAAFSGDQFAAITHMLVYALGLILPLLFFTLLYVHYQHSQVTFLRTKTITVFGRSVPISQFLSGILMVLVALIFIFHQGSVAIIPSINRSQFLDNVFDFQKKLLLLQ